MVWASVFHVLFETAAYIYVNTHIEFIQIYTYIYIQKNIYIQKSELTENGIFHLFAENRNGKLKFVFLGGQTVNDNRRLLLPQTCPSMLIC